MNQKHTLNWFGVIIDILMLILTGIDLIWLMFDALYTNKAVQTFIDPILPFYREVHNNFYVYDGLIVSIFMGEFLIRWVVAIFQQKHSKWFFYPFVHWYDVLGCFPTSSFRILRLFRVIGLVYRLHKWEVIDLNNYAFYKIILHYYNIIIEEISDRVVVTVLNEAKEEINRGQPLSDAIAEQILRPQKAAMAKAIGAIIQEGLRAKYPQYQKLLKKHILQTVQKVVRENEDVQQLERIPLVGSRLNQTLHTATSEIVFGVLDRLILDAASEDSEEIWSVVIDSIIDVLLQQQSTDNKDFANELVLETIDLVINRVMVRQWKTKE